MDFKGKKALVVGMAASGVSAARLLLKLGAEVYLYDAKPRSAFGYAVEGIIDLGARPFFGDERAAEIADVMVLSPGVPLWADVIKIGQERGIPILSEIELGYLTSRADIVAISGTNGKTTTTALTGEIFKAGGFKTYVLGNIGVPICDCSLDTKKGEVIIAETAALQLETIREFRPRACALLNITPDHLDRFLTMDYYTKCKAKMFSNQKPEDFAVLNYDDDIVRGLKKDVPSQVYWFSAKEELERGSFLKDGSIIFKDGKNTFHICDKNEVRMPGMHNIQNALAAVCLARVMGVSDIAIADTLKTFPGVEHRIEFVKKVGGVTFINDSKGTNPDATIKAIEAMDTKIALILGGYDKKISFDSLFNAFSGKVKGATVIGESTKDILLAAKRAGFSNIVPVDTFEDAVLGAFSMAGENDTVLLSPACASWGMFLNFEERGRIFKEIVNKL